MASPGSSDQSLLSRLNALKPTNINLAPSPAAIVPSASSTDRNGPDKTLLEKQPVLREDALAERLRILRNQPEINTTSSNSLSGTTLPASSSCTQPQYPATVGQKNPKEHQHKDQITPQDDVERRDGGIDDPGQADDDYLQFMGSGDPDQTLDDLLEGLDEYDLDGEDLDGPVLLSEFDPSGEAKKVADLLERFQKHTVGSGVPADGHGGTGKVSGSLSSAARGAGDGGRAENEDDDDSEGEQMTRDVEKILSQLRDEIGVPEDAEQDRQEKTNEKESGEHGKPGPSAPAPAQVHPGADEPLSEDSLSLPNVPASPLRDLSEDPTKESNQESRKSFDFENDMIARMASLKGLGSAINVDVFGLPLAPTFSPQDHQGSQKKKAKGAGYTDEDQKTWCIVCLDDATIRCVGCDDDVYCARCWKDMHMGPSAGYDERRHRWVKFER